MATDPERAIALLDELLDVSTERRLMLAYEILLRRRQIELFVELRRPETEVPYSQIARAAGTDAKSMRRALATAARAGSLTEALDQFVRLADVDVGAIRVAVHKARKGEETPARSRPSPVDWPRVRGKRRG